ncbi:DDE-type integrase/transposase/recombinase, partial [Rhizobium ruizarguesonis]
RISLQRISRRLRPDTKYRQGAPAAAASCVRSGVRTWRSSGEKFWLWRAVDQHGTVLEEILKKRRDKGAAKRVLVELM